MTVRWLPSGFVGLALSLLVFGFFTAVPALLAYPRSLLIAALVGGLSLLSEGRRVKRRNERLQGSLGVCCNAAPHKGER